MFTYMSSSRTPLFVRLIALLTFVLLVFPVNHVQADTSCQCVDYIKNRYALTGAIGGSGGAKDMGSYLSARGFVRINNPTVGAVVILKPPFGRGVNATAGHVAVITSVSDLGSDWRITIRGANQNSGSSTEYNCTNVGNWSPSSYPKSFGTTQIEYWTRDFALSRSTWTTSIQGSGYEGYRANDGNSTTRWSSKITSASSEWWTVDMGSSRTFDRVRIRWEAAYATNYFLGWSTDGTNYTGYWLTASNPKYITWLIGVHTARYVGIYMTQKAPGMGNYSFWDVNVLANGNPANFPKSGKGSTVQVGDLKTTEISIP